MKKTIYLFVCFAMLFSCEKSNNSIAKTIFYDVLNNNKSEIDISDYTDFEWDVVYVFLVPVSLEEINRTIGVEYNHYEEFSRPIIFVKNNLVIFSENENINLEGLSEGQLIYKATANTDRCLIRTRSTSKLKTKIMCEGKIKYLLLY